MGGVVDVVLLAPGLDDPVHEGGRRIVEEMGVVDDEHQPALPRPADELVDEPPQQLGAVRTGGTGLIARGKQGGQGAERHGGGGMGGGGPGRRGPGRLRQLQAGGSQAGLAGPGRPGQHDARAGWVAEQPLQPPDLVRPPDERPLAHRRSLSPAVGRRSGAVHGPRKGGFSRRRLRRGSGRECRRRPLRRVRRRTPAGPGRGRRRGRRGRAPWPRTARR